MITASHTYAELHQQAAAGVQDSLAQALAHYNSSRDAEEKEAWAEAIDLCCDALDSLADDLNA
jgi:hypothetical protein